MKLHVRRHRRPFLVKLFLKILRHLRRLPLELNAKPREELDDQLQACFGGDQDYAGDKQPDNNQDIHHRRWLHNKDVAECAPQVKNGQDSPRRKGKGGNSQPPVEAQDKRCKLAPLHLNDEGEDGGGNEEQAPAE